MGAACGQDCSRAQVALPSQPMKITFCCAGTPAEPWLASLRQALPQAQLTVWQPGDALADYGLVWAPPQQFIDEQQGIKALFNIGAGVDGLMKLALAPQLHVYRLEDAGMSVQMAEYVCQAVIRFFRGLEGYEAEMAQGRWALQDTPRRSDFPVGVMGLGVLGQRVAQSLALFDFPVNGWSRTPKPLDTVQAYAGMAALPDFLAASRILVNLLPLTPETENILNRHTLGLLQPGALVINVARGAHLVDEDLLALLDSGHVQAAVLDVFRCEPLPAGHLFWQHPRITMTPHTSARTLREDSIAQIVQKLVALTRGEAVSGRVTIGRGY